MRSREWLARNRLIANSRLCAGCNNEMTLITYTQILDGVRWKCNRCSRCVSLRKDSFFEKSHLRLVVLVELIYCWSFGMAEKQVAHETQVNKNTVVDWYSFMRDLTWEWYFVHRVPIGGMSAAGVRSVVEIDEAYFFR